MTEWFKQLSSTGRPSVTALSVSQLHLAAFGKHPGWEDHIPGIGMDTQALADLKQALYFDGIRTQIDSGAWEKMEQIKRIEGFDHAFLWLRPGEVLLGLMWSSTDRVGRSKYPMILCAEAENFSPAFMLAYAKPVLESLRNKCKAIASAEEVTAECHAALHRLKGIFERAQGGWAEPFSDVTERRQFLNCPELGPNQTGFLRVLHEYSTEQSFASTDKNSKHLRVPIIQNLQADTFTPWVEFFKCVVPSKVPILFIKNNETNWLDVIIGQPDSRDFFCLQAATDALPLTTEVPYEISPAAKSILKDVSDRLGLPAAPGNRSKAQAPADSSATPRLQTGAKSAPSRFLFFGIIIVVILAGVALIVLLKEKSSPPRGPATNKAATSTESAAEGMRYQTTIQYATDAFAKGNYDQAIQQANIALTIQPGDPVAAQIKADAENKKRDAEARGMSYATAMAAGRAALAQKNYNEAMRQVKNALAIKPGDNEAMTLDNTVEVQQEADARARQGKYDTAMAAGRSALAGGKYEDAIGQANIALINEPGDSEAIKLKNSAAEQENAAADSKVREQKYGEAMAAGHSAFSNRNYDEAVRQANIAQENKPDDPDAKNLMSQASAQLADLKQQQQYDSAMQEARTAVENKDYSQAINEGNIALGIRPEDTDAKNLISQANAQLAVQQHQQQYDSAVQAMQAAWAKNDYDTVIQQAVYVLAIKPDNNDAKVKLRDAIHDNLEIYAVWFGAMPPQKATSPVAKATSPLAQGNIAPKDANAYKKQIDTWIKTLDRYQLLGDADDKFASSIEHSIDSYGN